MKLNATAQLMGQQLGLSNTGTTVGEQLMLLREAKKAKYRNRPCACRSGLKFKNCCLGDIEAQYRDLQHFCNSH